MFLKSSLASFELITVRFDAYLLRQLNSKLTLSSLLDCRTSAFLHLQLSVEGKLIRVVYNRPLSIIISNTEVRKGRGMKCNCWGKLYIKVQLVALSTRIRASFYALPPFPHEICIYAKLEAVLLSFTTQTFLITLFCIPDVLSYTLRDVVHEKKL